MDVEKMLMAVSRGDPTSAVTTRTSKTTPPSPPRAGEQRGVRRRVHYVGLGAPRARSGRVGQRDTGSGIAGQVHRNMQAEPATYKGGLGKNDSGGKGDYGKGKGKRLNAFETYAAPYVEKSLAQGPFCGAASSQSWVAGGVGRACAPQPQPVGAGHSGSYAAGRTHHHMAASWNEGRHGGNFGGLNLCSAEQAQNRLRLSEDSTGDRKSSTIRRRHP